MKAKAANTSELSFAVTWEWADRPTSARKRALKRGELRLQPNGASLILRESLWKELSKDLFWSVVTLLMVLAVLACSEATTTTCVAACSGVITCCFSYIMFSSSGRHYELNRSEAEVLCPDPEGAMRIKLRGQRWVVLRGSPETHERMAAECRSIFVDHSAVLRTQDAWDEERLLEALRTDPHRCPACGNTDLQRKVKTWSITVAGYWYCEKCSCVWDPGWGHLASAGAIVLGAFFAICAVCGVILTVEDLTQGSYEYAKHTSWYNAWLPPTMLPYADILMFLGICGCAVWLFQRGIRRVFGGSRGIRLIQLPLSRKE